MKDYLSIEIPLMSKSDIIGYISEICGVKSLDENTTWELNGVDSMKLMSIVGPVKKKYNIKLNYVQLNQKLNTPTKLFEYIILKT